MSNLVKPVDLDRVIDVWVSGESEDYHTEMARLNDSLKRVDDDDAVGLYAQAMALAEEAAEPYRWAQQVMRVEIERRLHERRQLRGPSDTAPIAIPHSRVDVENVVEFGTYQIDVDQLEEAVRPLSEDERAKLLIIEPEHIIPERVVPAEFVPRSVRPGPVAAIKAAAKRYAGSPVGIALAASLKRDCLGDRTTIRPKKAALPQRGAL